MINAEIPEDLDFFIHRVGRTGRNGLKGTAITLYSPSDDQTIDSIEKIGVTFEPMEIKNDEIIKTYDRNRRTKREKSKDTLDPTLIGLVKKKKKKIKPGYKKKIDWAIAEKNKKTVKSNADNKLELQEKIRKTPISKSMTRPFKRDVMTSRSKTKGLHSFGLFLSVHLADNLVIIDLKSILFASLRR